MIQLISLNTWGGRAGKKLLLGFFEKYKNVDIFCLQEIWSAPYPTYEGVMAGGKPIKNSEIMTSGLQDITTLLSNHKHLFNPHLGENYGLMMLIKKDVEILDEGELFVYKEKGYADPTEIGNYARNIQYATIKTQSGVKTIINFHGLWDEKTRKNDNPDRLIQSEKIVNFVRGLKNPFILAGDFNLNPDTESIKKLEMAGFRNLIREYDIQTTRTSYYKKPERFADYTLVSSEIKVNDFKILPEEVSDHSAMYLNFN